MQRYVPLILLLLFAAGAAFMMHGTHLAVQKAEVHQEAKP